MSLNYDQSLTTYESTRCLVLDYFVLIIN